MEYFKDARYNQWYFSLASLSSQNSWRSLKRFMTNTQKDIYKTLAFYGQLETDGCRTSKTDTSVKISVWNSKLTSVQRLHWRKLNHFTHNIYINSEVQELEWWKTSLEVGTEESEGMQSQQIKGRLTKEYRLTRRLRMVLKTEMNSKQIQQLEQ